jgi:hypothetical protein
MTSGLYRALVAVLPSLPAARASLIAPQREEEGCPHYDD